MPDINYPSSPDESEHSNKDDGNISGTKVRAETSEDTSKVTATIQ